jgi:hypothetical protein
VTMAVGARRLPPVMLAVVVMLAVDNSDDTTLPLKLKPVACKRKRISGIFESSKCLYKPFQVPGFQDSPQIQDAADMPRIRCER